MWSDSWSDLWILSSSECTIERNNYGKKLSVQEIILTLQNYWSNQGCLLLRSIRTEKRAGQWVLIIPSCNWTRDPAECGIRGTFTSSCGNGRYGENPNRLFQPQFQVVMKPSPENIQIIFRSLEALGINPLRIFDIRFVEDNWRTLHGCAGLGWVWLDGMEVTQFTYFQQVGGLGSVIASRVRLLTV